MKSILNTITAMLAAVLFIPAESAQTTSNPRMQVKVTLEKLSLYMRQSPSIVETSYYPLLNKDETPFSVSWLSLIHIFKMPGLRMLLA